MDVTSSDSVASFLSAVHQRLGPLEVLVCNAGIMWVGPFAEESEVVALRQFAVNFHGVARAMRLALPGMLERRRGHVIVIASAASHLAPPGEATYAATKHAVAGYCDAVRAELHGSPIEISVVKPGVVTTELAAGTSAGRATKALAPQQVADAVVDLVRHPRQEIFIPASVGGFTHLQAPLGAHARAALARAVVPDQLEALERDDTGARRAYEEKLRDSESGGP